MAPKHQHKLGVRIWLYLYILNKADWETGMIWGWKDKDVAEEMEMPWRTLQKQRQRLVEDEYIECGHGWQCINIRVINWQDPRNDSTQNGVLSDPHSTQYSTQHSTHHPSRKVGTPTLNQHNTLQNTHIKQEAPDDSTAQKLYMQATGQAYIIPGIYDFVIEMGKIILEQLGGDFDAALKLCQEEFVRWANTNRKDGSGKYKKTNPDWMKWVIERLSPTPITQKNLEDMTPEETKEYIRQKMQENER